MFVSFISIQISQYRRSIYFIIWVEKNKKFIGLLSAVTNEKVFIALDLNTKFDQNYNKEKSHGIKLAMEW